MLVDTARTLLASSDLFGSLPEASVARLAAAAVEAHFKDGDVLFHQGDPGDALHIIVGGVVQVSVQGQDEETVVAILGPGECVGELSLIDGRPRSATVEALEPVNTVVVPRAEFVDVIRSHVPTMEALLVTLVERLRQTDALAADISHLRTSS